MSNQYTLADRYDMSGPFAELGHRLWFMRTSMVPAGYRMVAYYLGNCKNGSVKVLQFITDDHGKMSGPKHCTISKHNLKAYASMPTELLTSREIIKAQAKGIL